MLFSPGACDRVVFIRDEVLVRFSVYIVPQTHGRQNDCRIFRKVKSRILFLCKFFGCHSMDVIAAERRNIKCTSKISFDFEVILTLGRDSPSLGHRRIIMRNLFELLASDRGHLLIRRTVICTLRSRPHKPIQQLIFELCTCFCNSSRSCERNIFISGIAAHHKPLHKFLIGIVSRLISEQVAPFVRIPAKYPNQEGPPFRLKRRIVTLLNFALADPANSGGPSLPSTSRHPDSPPYFPSLRFFSGGIRIRPNFS